MKTEVIQNNNKITIKNLRVEAVYNNNEFLVLPFPDESIDLEKVGKVKYIHFETTDNLSIGDIISIENINHSNDENRLINEGWKIARNFDNITIEQKFDKEQVNQDEVLSWINNGFSLQLDADGTFIDSKGGEIIHPNEVKDLNGIFQAIENYIKNHPNQFKLGKFFHENYNRGVPRSWWSPTINNDYGMIGTTFFYDDWKTSQVPSGCVVGTRGIENKNDEQSFIHPGALTKTQYEELKKLIPNTCHVEGCCNNHPDDPLAQSENSHVSIIDNKCKHHRGKTHSDPNDTNPTIIRARNTYENSANLTEVNQAINDLENIKVSNRKAFNNWGCEEVLKLLKSKKLVLENNNEDPDSGNNVGEETEENTNQGNDTGNGTEPKKGQDIPVNNTNSSLQETKNNAIQEIINTLANQEPKLTTEHLSEINQDWKKKINAADNENDIINIKDQVMADIAAKRKAKKEAENIVNNLETEGKDADQLKKQLQEVEKSKGQQGYEDNQTGIDNLKNELAKKVSKEEYSQIIVDEIKKNMAKYDIKENELSPELKKDWEKLKSGEFKSKEQVDEVEKKLAKDTGQKGSEKKLSKILQEAQEALKLGNKNKIKAVKSKLYNLLVSNDIYEKVLLVSKKGKEVKQMLKNLENNSFQKQTSSDKFPWKVVIPVTFVLITMFVLGIIIYRKKKKKLK